MIKAILFDADNTIYYTKQVAKKGDIAAMQFFSKQTKKSASQLYKEWKRIINALKNSRDPKKRHRKYSYSKLAKKFDLKKVNEAYQISMYVIMKNLKIEPTFKNSIKKLKKIKLAIVTEDFKEQVVQKLNKLKLMEKFDTIITSDKTKKMKPDKIYYKLAFRKLSVRPEECVVVGDNFEKDLKIPKQLGCTTVLFKKKDKRVHYCINNFKELIKILKEKI